MITDEEFKAFLDSTLEAVLKHIEALKQENGNVKHILKTQQRFRPEIAFWSEQHQRIQAAKNAVGVSAWDIIVNIMVRERIREQRRRM